MSHRIISEAITISLALGMAILVWIVAVREENPITINLYPQKIPLKVIPPANGIIAADNDAIPTDIQLRLRAPQSSWQELSPNKFEAKLDLSNYPLGLHNVPLQVIVSDQHVEVEEVFPAEVNVQLESLVVKQMPVTIRITGDPPKGFAYQLPREPISVTVKGPAPAVQEIERVESQIFLNNVRETLERGIRPLPKNMLNETVESVTIEPLRTTIVISVEQKFGYSNVGIKARVVGEPAPGYFINSIITEPSEIVLRGLDDAPSSIETAEVDVSGTTKDVIKRVPLILPPGFSVEVGENEDPENSRSTLVTVEVSAFTGGLSVERRLTIQGAGQDLIWEVVPETVDVFLTGPWPLLQNLSGDDITVIVDLFDLGAGLHRLQPTVIKPEALEVTSVIPDIIDVTIEPNASTPIPNSMTPDPTITSTVVTTKTDIMPAPLP